MIGSDKALNPHIINFFVKLLIKSPSVKLENMPSICLGLFNLLLSQAVIFCGDVDSKIVDKLFDTCANILQLVIKNITKFAGAKSVIESFLNNKILQVICIGLDFEMEDINARKRQLLNLQVVLFAMHDTVLRKNL